MKHSFNRLANPITQMALTLVAILAPMAFAATAPVGDPEVKTDHTYYQGELAYSTAARIVSSALATPGRPTTGDPVKDQIIKLWYWRLEHYYHLMSPEEYNVPGVTPNPPSDNPLMTDYDCLSQQFSFGHGVCGTNHAMLRPIFEAAGFKSRRRSIVGDTTHEVFYGGRWAMVNTDSASIISLTNTASSEFAGVDDIIANTNLLLNYPLAIPQYPYGSQISGSQGTRSQDWYGYYNGGFNLSTTAASHMYGEGYQARPVVYLLKRGEKFTRFADRDGLPGYLGAAGSYRWWGCVMTGGPFRDWSYVGANVAPALQSPPTSNALGNSRFGNGIFEWAPTIAAGDMDDAVVAKDAAIAYSSASPHLAASSGTAKITVAHFSPYCIAGIPSDGKDPAQNGATGGAWIVPSAVGSVPMEVSVNNGASWIAAGSLSGATPLDFTDLVKGRRSYLLRFTVGTAAGLDSFTLKTAVEVATAVFPMLKANGSTVTYNAGNTGVVEVIPDYSSLATANAFKVADSGNVTFTPMSSSATFPYQSTTNQPIWVSYNVTAPPGTKLKKIDAAADISSRIPPPGTGYVQLSVSTDGGATFSLFSNTSPDNDDELSHYWGYGAVDITSANVNSAIVKVTSYNGGYTAGIRSVRLYGEYTTAAPGALSITHTWDDSSGTGKTFTQNLAAGTTSTSYTVATAGSPVSRSIAFSVAPSPSTQILTSITVSPATATVAAGATQTFTASAKDQVGAAMVPQPAITWTVSGGGSISSAGVFTAGTASGGPFTVTAGAGGKSGTASVTVTPTTTVGTITVSPSSASVAVQGMQTFTASAKDQFGNTMSPQPTLFWTVSGGGSISAAGVFTAGTVSGGPFTVTASAGGKSGTASVSVTPSTTVGSIVVAPSSATVLVSATKQFSATAKDPFGNTMSPQPTLAWSVSGGGTINATGLFTAGSSAGGPFTVTAGSGGKTGTASVTVATSQTFTAIVVSPSNATVVAGATQAYSAVANDQFGNAMAVQPAFTWTATGGTISSAGLFTAGSTAGTFAVKATSGAINGTAAAVVSVPPVLTSITLTPSTATLAVGMSKQFTAVALDQFGAALATQPTLTWTTTAGTISASGLFTAQSTAGSATVRAASGAVSGSAAVTVTPLPSITSPPNINGNVNAGTPVTITTGGTDPAGGTLNIVWNFGDGSTGSGGSVTHTFANPGAYTVTVVFTSPTSGGVTTTTFTVNVVDPNGAGAAGTPLLPMTFKSVLGSMTLNAPGKDSLSFSGTIPGLPAGFDPTNMTLTLKTGTAVVPFTLDKHGRAHTANGSVSLQLKLKRDPKTKLSAFVGGNAPIKGRLQKGTWAANWGFAAGGPLPATLPIEVDLGSTAYGLTVTIAGKQDPKHAHFKH